MKNSLLLPVVLVLLACSHNQPQESVPAGSKPEAVLNPPSAMEEGSLTKSLQDSHNALQTDSTELLQSFYEETLKDLAESLKKAKRLLRLTAPAAHTY